MAAAHVCGRTATMAVGSLRCMDQDRFGSNSAGFATSGRTASCVKWRETSVARDFSATCCAQGKEGQERVDSTQRDPLGSVSVEQSKRSTKPMTSMKRAALLAYVASMAFRQTGEISHIVKADSPEPFRGEIVSISIRHWKLENLVAELASSAEDAPSISDGPNNEVAFDENSSQLK